MSFQEKSIIASLYITLVVWGYYFFRMYQYTENGTATLSVLGDLLIGAVILTVIIEIVAQALIAGYSRKENASDMRDERDRAIVYRSTYQASYVLVVGVVLTVIVALVTESLVSALNTLVLHFIAAEVWRYVTQLYFYRRGL